MASSTGNNDRAAWLTQQAVNLVDAGSLEVSDRSCFMSTFTD